MDTIELSSVYTGNKHRIRVWLPNDMDEKISYPVLYMMDGQNVYFDEESFSGHSWRVIEYMNTKDVYNQMIVVAINNSSRRYEEYSPWKNEKRKTNFEDREYGGDGDKYSDFIAREIKPYIDEHYKTKSDRSNTYIVGSSMGAFISTYTAFKYSDVFGNVGCFSIASWFAENEYLNFVENVNINSQMKIFIYVGGKETSDANIKDMSTWYTDNTKNLYDVLQKKSIENKNIRYVFKQNGEHTESCWAEVLPECMEFLSATANK